MPKYQLFKHKQKAFRPGETSSSAISLATSPSPISVTELLWLAIIFLLPLFFIPSINTTFELPKVVLFRGLTAALTVSWLIQVTKQKSFSTLSLHAAHSASSTSAHPASSTAAHSASSTSAHSASSASDLSTAVHSTSVPALPNGKKARTLIIFLFFVIASWIISTLFSSAPIISVFGYYPRFQGLYTWLFYVIFATIVFLNLKTPRQIERILLVISMSAFFASLAAILQKFNVPWLNFWDTDSFLGRAFGTMGHPDFLASFLIMAIPLTTYLLIKRKYVIFSITTLILSIYTTVLTFSRSALLGLIISALFMLIIYALKIKNRRLLYAAIIAPLIILVAVICINAFSGNDLVRTNPVLQRITLTGENLRSVQTRLQIWPATIKQILARPLTGYGLDTFAITFPAFYPKELNKLENLGDYPDRAHSFALDYASDLGILALIVFILFVAYLIIESVRFIFKEKENWLAPLMILGSLFAVITANKFGFFVTCTWVYFWLLLAILLTWQIQIKVIPVSPQFNSRLKFFIIFLSIFSLVNFYINDFSLIKADALYRNDNLFEAADVAPGISFYAENAAQKVADWAVASSTEAATNEAPAPGRAPIQTDSYDKPYDQSDNYYIQNFEQIERADSAIENAGAITNKDGTYYRIKGQILALKADSAYKEMFQKAIEKMPNYPPLYLDYGKALIENSSYAEAIPIIQTYLSLCPDYYLWEKDLAARTPDEQNKFRIFYKLNPDFNEVFGLLDEAKQNTGSTNNN